LGSLVSELQLTPPDSDTRLLAPITDKTLFSMITPEIDAVLSSQTGGSSASSNKSSRINAIIVGIESHICVTQTTLDLLARGHGVYVLADGVSSCHKEEVPVALRRLESAGATISTSESVLYEIMRDASIPEFKQVAGLVRESKEATQAALQSFAKI
jgi:isochorismate hydrolase